MEDGRINSWIFLHSRKEVFSNLVIEDDKISFVNDWHPENQFCSNDEREFGRIITFNDLQWVNAFDCKWVRDEGKWICVKL